MQPLRKAQCFGFPRSVLAVVASSWVAAGIVQTRSPEKAAWLGSEDGPFEIASAAAFAVGFLLVLRRFVREPSALGLADATMLAWAALRELDFQKRYTYRSIESLGFYTRPDAPWTYKLLAVAALVPLVVAGSYLMITFLKRLRPAWVRHEPWAGYALGAIFLTGTGMALEKLFGFQPAEEVCETGSALLVLLLAWKLAPWKDRETKPRLPEAL